MRFTYSARAIWDEETGKRVAQLLNPEPGVGPLFAAAPTLLAEVEALLEVIDYGGLKLPDNDRAFILETRLRAAVALARGE
jgi:hypothetical protein